MKSCHKVNFLWGFQYLWWGRPTIAFWDWYFCIVVLKFETDTETFVYQSQILRLILRLLEYGLKAWDWPWDHPGLSLSLETKVSLISETQNLLIKLKKLVVEKVGCIFTQSQYEETVKHKGVSKRQFFLEIIP